MLGVAFLPKDCTGIPSQYPDEMWADVAARRLCLLSVLFDRFSPLGCVAGAAAANIRWFIPTFGGLIRTVGDLAARFGRFGSTPTVDAPLCE